ncbi:MAG: hypothetical protein AMS26_12770 [Bacteroides sp. SM23_62]|nr:MAG: hypothetical protein AMS26_12770 [Bacteroides sp. SM23_62]
MKYICLTIPVIFLLAGCAVTKTSYHIQAGGSWGGIIEDTKMDAVTGATKMGVNLGVHPAVNINRRLVETGLDFLTYNQSWMYFDAGENYDGKRDLKFGELRFPLTYNFQLFRDSNDEGQLQIKLGLSAGYILYHKFTDSGTVPDYTLDNFSIGPAFGLSTIPIKLNDKLQLGLYLDFVRVSKVYKDLYITTDNVGNLSNIKFGAVLRIH